MAGLMQRAPQGQPLMAADDPMLDQQAEDESNVSPEEQQDYDVFVTNGMKLMYSEQVMPQILKTIGDAGDPVEGLGAALASLVMRLEDSAGDAGADYAGDVKLHAATELLEHMVELVEAAGIHEFSEQEMESALYQGFDLYRTIRQEQGMLDQGSMAEDMDQLAAADQQGRADDILPGISEYAQRAPMPEGAETAMQQARAPQPGAMRRGA